MNRSQARRRRGATRMKRKNPSVDQVAYMRFQGDLAEERRLGLCGDRDTYTALKFWPTAYHRPTFVYFVTEERRSEFVKIGRAVDPIDRLAELQCGNARRLVLRHLIVGSAKCEKYHHRHWRAAHVAGEWFGEGYGDAILTLAAETSRRQIEAHKNGENETYVRDLLPQDVLTRRIAA